MTVGELITELKERDNDPTTPVQINGHGDIIDIEFTDDGVILLLGDSDE